MRMRAFAAAALSVGATAGVCAMLAVLLHACGDARDELPQRIRGAIEDPLRAVKMGLDELADLPVVRHATQGEISRYEAEPAGYIVAFRSSDSPQTLQFTDFLSESKHHYAALDDVYLPDTRVESIRYLTAVGLDVGQDPDAVPGIVLPRSMQLTFATDPAESPVAVLAKVLFSGDDAAREILAEWERDGRIWWAEPNGYSELSGSSGDDSDQRHLQDGGATEGGLFNNLKRDYENSSAEHTRVTKIPEALGVLAGRDLASSPSDKEIIDNPPIVAVLDSGTDFTHPALEGRIWTNATPGASGCKNDVHGCDTTKAIKGSLGDGDVFPFSTTGPGQSCNQVDECEHGTHVAGIIVGNAASGRGTAGTCPVCQVMTIKVVQKIGNKGRVSDEAQVAGMKYLTRFRRSNGNAVRVINSSFGKYSRSRSVAVLVSLLRRSGNGVLVVAAAGNEDSMGRTYPAGFADAIAVSAVDATGRKTGFSNFGPWVDIAAPGASVNSSIPGGGDEAKPGTSMASPVVAGIAGLIVASKPGIGFSELRSRILRAGDPKIYSQQENEGFNFSFYYVKVPGESIRRPLLGTGLIDAQLAVQGKDSGGLISPALDRVTPGCGVVGAARTSHAQSGSEWGGVLALLPMLLALMVAIISLLRSRRAEELSTSHAKLNGRMVSYGERG